MKVRYWLSLTVAFTVACSDDDGSMSAPGDETSASTSGEVEEPATGDEPVEPGSTGDPSVDDDAGSSTGAESVEPPGPAPAGGIAVDWIDANQGTAIPVAQDGEAFETGSSLINDRRMMLRAGWTVEDDWTPRAIEARLTWVTPDGEETVRSDVLNVAGPRDPDPLAPAFEWVIEPSQVVADATFSIELWELEPAAQGADVDDLAPPRFPALGRASLPILDGRFPLDLVIVPINYSGAGCWGNTDLTAELLAPMLEDIYMQHPINELTVLLHEPIAITEGIETSSNVLDQVIAVRAEDDPAPGTFYLGLIDVCHSMDFAGSAWVLDIPPVQEDASQRAAWARFNDWSLHYSPGQVGSHELTHSLGRQHVICQGHEGNPDRAYPIEGGGFGGAPGWGVLDYAWRDPADTFDLMTYCDPGWISPYGWDTLLPVVQEIGTWDTEGAPAVDGNEVLIGVRPVGGEVRRWIRTTGRLRAQDRRRSERVELRDPAGTTTHADVYARETAEGDSELVIIPLPESAPSTLAVTHTSPAGIRTYELSG